MAQKTNYRTVLETTLSSVSSYSSGSLEVGDVDELILYLTVTGTPPTSGELDISKVDAFGNVYPPFSAVNVHTPPQTVIAIGPESGSDVTTILGDLIQFDLANIPVGQTVSAQITVKGK